MAAKRDYYDILGVPRDASDDDIKKAFRKLAHQLHPDKSGGDEAKFKEVNEAYQALSDKEKRSRYDQFGHDFEQAGGQGGGNPFGGFGGQGAHFDFGDLGGFGDVFGQMFGGTAGGGGQGGRRGRSKGRDIEMDVRLDFKEAVFGADKPVKLYCLATCESCRGNGAEPGAKLEKCGECQGSGQVRRVQQTMFGVFQTTAVCGRCGGEGQVPEKRCHTCDGTGLHKQHREFTLKIPAGIEDGVTLRVAGEGEAAKGSRSGDLFVTVRVTPDRRFRRSGDDILSEVSISFAEAALGTTASVPTVDGDVDLKIPAGTQPGAVLRLKAKGVPHLKRAGARGDHLVTVNVEVPTKLTRKQRKILEEWGD